MQNGRLHYLRLRQGVCFFSIHYHPVSIALTSILRFPAARKELAQWLSEGKIQRKETILRGGLKVAEQALADLYKGINTGESPICPGESHVWDLSGTEGICADENIGKLLVEVNEDNDDGIAKSTSRL